MEQVMRSAGMGKDSMVKGCVLWAWWSQCRHRVTPLRRPSNRRDTMVESDLGPFFFWSCRLAT